MLTSWKSIAVFIDDTVEAERICNYAAELARCHGAHLIGIHGVPGHLGELHADAFVRGARAISEMAARHMAAERAEAAAVESRFTVLSAKYDLSSEFRVIGCDQPASETVFNALCCDLIVIGHPRPYGLPSNWKPDRLLMASGVPTLLVPEAWTAGTVGQSVLLAWNASRPARRAIADAMPFLTAAKSVTVLVVDPERIAGRLGPEPGADVALYLARHGVNAHVTQAISDGAPVADIIRATAWNVGSDLIVIGAYGHARAAEIVLGGVTRDLLANLPAPTLISH